MSWAPARGVTTRIRGTGYETCALSLILNGSHNDVIGEQGYAPGGPTPGGCMASEMRARGLAAGEERPGGAAGGPWSPAVSTYGEGGHGPTHAREEVKEE